MQKLSLFFAFVVLFTINVNSQTNDNLFYNKGKISLSSSFGGVFGGGSYMLGLNARPGIFVINKLNLGTEFGRKFSNNPDNRNMHFLPTIEYYLLNKRITPVIKAGYFLETRNFNNERTFYQSPVVGLGVAFINKSGTFGVNVGADYYFNKTDPQGGFRPNVSFSFYFNRKKKNKNVVY